VLYCAGMKVILLKHVKDLGPQGAVVNVSDGYAINCLIPQKKAVFATNQAVTQQKRQADIATARAEKQKRKLQSSIGKLDGYRLTLKEAASETGTLYAAVTAKKIADALQRAGFDVSQDAVQLKEPLKDAGEQQIALKLPHNLSATIKLIIKNK
jgi:large subunit ribosomal protein L9